MRNVSDKSCRNLTFEYFSKKKTVQKIQVSLKSVRITGTLHEDQYTFLIISRLVPPRMRNVSDKSCRENRNTCFMFNNFFAKIEPFMN